DSVVVLGVLIKVFRRDPVARRGSFARQSDIALKHLIGVAADFDAGAVAIESLHPVRWTRTPIAIVVVMAAPIVRIMVAAPATLVLTWSHDTFEVLMHVLSIYRFSCVLLETPGVRTRKERLSAGAWYRRLRGAEPSWLPTLPGHPRREGTNESNG